MSTNNKKMKNTRHSTIRITSIALVLLSSLPISLSSSVQAQTGNSIWGRCGDYYYPFWYDECNWYSENPGYTLGPTRFYAVFSHETDTGTLVAGRIETEHPMSIRGVAVMLSLDYSGYSVVSNTRAEEWLYIYTIDTSGLPGARIDSARWDTASQRIMFLPQDLQRELAHDTTGAMRALVFEVFFDHAVTVDTTFFIAGTCNSNEKARDGYYPYLFKHTPTIYASVYNCFGDPCDDCIDKGKVMYINTSTGHVFSNLRIEALGPFIAIPGEYTLTALSADTMMGSVTGGGTYHSGEPATVSATPARFCRFDHWSDGSTDNPRVIHLCADSTVTAFFRHDSSNYVRVLPNNPDWGATTGTGIYPYGASVTIEATPAAGYLFTEWADGSTDNPRTVLPVSDTVFTALFDPPEVGINTVGDSFSVTPNPTDGTVTVTAATSGYTLRLFDSAGRLLANHQVHSPEFEIDLSHLPSGIYTLALTSRQLTLTKAIIKL